MNPDAWQMAVIRSRTEEERRIEQARRSRLHAAAKARRAKAKRGGKR